MLPCEDTGDDQDQRDRLSETRGSSVNEVKALGVFKSLLEGAFHCT
jgi:hypothetical protein